MSSIAFDIDQRPPLQQAVPLGFQHVIAMLLGNITPPLLVAGALGIDPATTTLFLQMVLLMAGLATIVQAYPIGPVGGKIPVVMGTSIAFVGGSIAVGSQYGLAAVLGACLVGGLVEIGLGFSMVRLRKFFPPLVNSVVVMLIGLTLIPVGMDYAAGGKAASDYGSPTNLAIAATVFLITLFLNQLARGFVSHASMLFGVAIGYCIALGLGRVDLSSIHEAAWFAFPKPFELGLEFHLTPIIIMAFIYVISTMETIGDISGILAALGRQPTTRELRGGLVADGVMSSLAAVFGALPNTSYSQNVGLINFTGIASRHVTAISGCILVTLGLVPKIAAVFASMPAEVIGGGGLIMFAMIFASGVAIVDRDVELDRRNLVIMAVSVGIGLAVELRPAALAALPETIRSLLGSGLISGGFCALALNIILPGRSRSR